MQSKSTFAQIKDPMNHIYKSLANYWVRIQREKSKIHDS